MANVPWWGSPTYLAAAAHQLFAAAAAGGLGHANDSQVVEIYRGRATVGE